VAGRGSGVMKSVGWPAIALVAGLVAGGAIVAGRSASRSTASPAAYRFPIELPDSVGVANGVGIKLAMSRDGSQLVVAGMKEGRRALYLRRSSDIEAQRLAGTDSGYNPSFSPDGRWLLFQSGARLLKVRLSGGAPEPILDSAVVASWGDDGSLLYEKGNALWRVSAGGGESRRVALPDGERGHRRYSWPEVLPGSRHALITIWRGGGSLDSARLGTVSLSDGKVTDLGIRGANPHYAATGHVVFAQVGGSVAAVPFSLRRLAVTGTPVRLLQNVWSGGGGGTDFAVSDNGALAYHGGVPDAEDLSMLAVDRDGRSRPLAALGKERFGEPRLAPDGRHLAVAIGPPQPSDTGQVWVYDLASGARTRLSSTGVNIRPEWSRDGARVLYISRQRDSQFVVAQRWDRPEETQVLARGRVPAFYELAMGPVTGWSAIRTGLAPGGSAIVIAPTESLSATRPFETGERVVITPRISPNGRLIAYVATVAGRREVFVRPVPGPGPQVAVSREGGTEPVWSPDGATLYFRGLTHLMTSSVVERPALAVTPPVPLFAIEPFKPSVAHTGYDIFPGGDEFLMLGGWGRAQSRVYVLANWTQTLADRPPVAK
jgi:eukaryotic-like serine/threonine-protein kinase